MKGIGDLLGPKLYGENEFMFIYDNEEYMNLINTRY